jgi:hypothetical protein
VARRQPGADARVRGWQLRERITARAPVQTIAFALSRDAGPRAYSGGVNSRTNNVIAISCVLLAVTGCSQIQMLRCVREKVNSNEPYQTQAERDATEALARQLCLRKAAGQGN